MPHLHVRETNVPEALSRSLLNSDVPLGVDRYAPRSESERIISIVSFWNILDRLMWNASRLIEHGSSTARATVGRRHLWQTGYMRELQLRRMLQLVQQHHSRHRRPLYCEIGMNGGHSVAAMLIANSHMVAHVFDVMAYKYSGTVSALLSVVFGERFQLHVGTSSRTLAAWVRNESRSESCNLIYVDGDHEALGARRDLALMRHAAAPLAHVIVDDIHFWPGLAVYQEVIKGNLQILEQWGPFERHSRYSPCMRTPEGMPKNRELCPPWGFVVARYNQSRKR